MIITENLSNNSALILVGIVVIMHFAMWLEAILFKHGWRKVIVFAGLLSADIFLIGLLGCHNTLINIEVALVAATMIIFWDAKINIEESKDRVTNNDDK